MHGRINEIPKRRKSIKGEEVVVNQLTFKCNNSSLFLYIVNSTRSKDMDYEMHDKRSRRESHGKVESDRSRR